MHDASKESEGEREKKRTGRGGGAGGGEGEGEGGRRKKEEGGRRGCWQLPGACGVGPFKARSPDARRRNCPPRVTPTPRRGPRPPALPA
jgi:hypothetical protein